MNRGVTPLLILFVNLQMKPRLRIGLISRLNQQLNRRISLYFNYLLNSGFKSQVSLGLSFGLNCRFSGLIQLRAQNPAQEAAQLREAGLRPGQAIRSGFRADLLPDFGPND